MAKEPFLVRQREISSKIRFVRAKVTHRLSCMFSQLMTIQYPVACYQWVPRKSLRKKKTKAKENHPKRCGHRLQWKMHFFLCFRKKFSEWTLAASRVGASATTATVCSL